MQLSLQLTSCFELFANLERFFCFAKISTKKSQNKLLVIFILVTCRLIANDRTIYHTYLSQPSTNDIHPYSCQASQFQTHSKFQYHC